MSVSESVATALAGRYTVRRELGRGGMATVYLADDVRHHRPVAIKVLHPELSAMLGVNRFLREIETTAGLQHPHILALFDSGDANGELYYVMPFVDGESLRARLDREGQLPIADAVRITGEIADALEYAHARGIIHRDIKPENILLQSGHAVVADFGIAMAVQQASGARLTQTGFTLGSPQYMSPEQALGERIIDTRADIYALGAVTYEMLAGQPPFMASTAQGVLARALAERPRSLAAIRESIAPNVESAVLTALARLPADRFATVRAYADELARALLVRDARATVLPPISRGQRAFPLLATLALGLIGGAAAWHQWSPVPGPAVSGGDESRFYSVRLPDSAPLMSGQDRFGFRLRSLSGSADGRILVYASGSGGSTSLWQIQTALGVVMPLEGTSGAVLPTMSADGRSVAFLTNGELRLLDLTTRTSRTIASMPDAFSMAWPFADHLLVGISDATCARTVSVASGAVGTFPEPRCVAARDVSPFVDSASTYPITNSDGVLAMVDTRTGTIRRVRHATSDSSYVLGSSAFVLNNGTLVYLADSTLYGAPYSVELARLGAEPRPILAGIRHESWTDAAHLALASNGTLVWAAGSDANASRFVWVDASGRVRDTIPVPAARVVSFALSADGQQLAYSVPNTVHGTTIKVVNLARQAVDSARFDHDLAVVRWGDRGRALVVERGGSDGMTYELLRVGSVTIAPDSATLPYENESADGKLRCLHGRFWPVKSPGDSVRFDVDARHQWCSFSPDARSIAWVMRGQIFIAPTDSTARRARRLLVAANGDEPLWSTDGKQVLFRASHEWYAVSVSSLASGGSATPHLLFSGAFNQADASWALGPHDRFLLLLGPAQVQSDHLNVLTNFPAYVAKKLAIPAP